MVASSYPGVMPTQCVTHQLNHLYLRPAAQGTGLADAILELALPDRMSGVLWIIGGNESAATRRGGASTCGTASWATRRNGHRMPLE